MNVLIAYASKSGTTEKCAKILKAHVENSVLCDLTRERPDLRDYGCIIVGGSIRMGNLHKAAKDFILRNKDVLMRKKCAFFLCNCFTDRTEAFLEKNIPKELLKKAITSGSFGGELNADKQTGLDRLITKLVSAKSKGDKNLKLHTSSEAIHKFSEKIK